MNGIISYIHTGSSCLLDNCRQATTTAEKSNYLKEKPDYPTDNSKIYARLF